MALTGSSALGVTGIAEIVLMQRRDKQNLRDIFGPDHSDGAGRRGPALPDSTDADALWARTMISELSSDPAIWSTPSGADPDWALADLQDDAGFLDDLMSGAALLGGDEADDLADLPALGPDPALDDLFAGLPTADPSSAADTAPKPRRRPLPVHRPADPGLDDIFAPTAARQVGTAPMSRPAAPILAPPAKLPAADTATIRQQAAKPRGLRALRRVFVGAGRQRRVDG